MHFKKYILVYTIIPLLVLLSAASYYRFMVSHDYLVTYEGGCDPYTQECFVYCEDDECADPFYYSMIEREAWEIHARCGTDITTCDDAYECQEDVAVCSFSYCDTEVSGEECEQLTENDLTLTES